MSKKLWGGRFKKGPDAAFERYSASFVWDVRLLPYDLRIDAAHVNALKKCGVLSSAEASKLQKAINLLTGRLNAGKLRFDLDSEDVHSAVQEALKSVAGDVADKLHTGRSRNDLVAQSSRLYCLEHARKIQHLLRRLQAELVGKAEQFQEVCLAGMTHMQHAQAMSVAHLFLAYTEMFERSITYFKIAEDLSDVCVLGSGALAGSTFALDQRQMAAELGLHRVTRNSYDVSGDRDFVWAFLTATALAGLHFSRLAEDLMIGQLRGQGLFDIDESLCTGSSMMPQKKNADFVELLRGVSGVFLGNAAALSFTLKGLPTSYNRDLQWDKRSLFESSDLSQKTLEILIKLVRSLAIRRERANEHVDDASMYATDIADYLVAKGVSFKSAHAQVGQLVKLSEECGVPLSKIGLDLIRDIAPKADGEIYDLFDAEHSIRMKKTVGSTHPGQVASQIRRWRKYLKGESLASL